jgi:phosphatidylglycerophosphate synthase
MTEKPQSHRDVIEPNYFSNWGDLWYPRIANLLLLPVSKVRWITPNAVTVASLGCYTVACVGVAASNTLPLLWAALLPVSYVLDCLDGQLARFTARGSVLGDYLDKTFDVLKIGIINLAFGYHAFVQSGSALFLVLAFLSCFGFLFRYYIKLETMFSCANRDTDYLEKSRVRRRELHVEYARIGAGRRTLADHVGWLWLRHRSVLALDEAEHVTFGAIAVALNSVEVWLWVFALGQVGLAFFRLVERGYLLSRRPAKLLDPMRK